MDEFHRQHGRNRYWTIPPKPDEKRTEHKQARQRLKAELQKELRVMDAVAADDGEG